MIMLKKLKSFLTAKTRRGRHNKSNPLNAVDDVNSNYDGDGNIRSSRALNDANDVAKLLIKMHEARMSSDYLTTNNVHNEDIVQPAPSNGRKGPFASKLSVSGLCPVPMVLKAFRRVSGGSNATTATTSTFVTNRSANAASTGTTNATSIANTSFGSHVNETANVDGKDEASNDPHVCLAYESNLTPLDLLALEFSEPAAIPALCLPSDTKEYSSSHGAAGPPATARRSSRITVFEVLENFANLSDMSAYVNMSNAENASSLCHRENSLPVPPNSPCTPAKGCGLFQLHNADESRSLKPWGRRRIRSHPEFEDIFRPFTSSTGDEDIFGPIILLAPTSPSRRVHKRAVSLGAATSNGFTHYHSKTYELADPRIYPKDSCFTTCETCPCLPTLIRSSTMPSLAEPVDNSSLTAYLAGLANELNGMTPCSSSTAPSLLDTEDMQGDSVFSDLVSSAQGQSRVDWPEAHTSLFIGSCSDSSEDGVKGAGRLLQTVSLPVVTPSDSAPSILQSVTARVAQQEEVELELSHASNCLQLDTTNGSLLPAIGGLVAHDTFGPGINVVSKLSLAGTVSLDSIPIAETTTNGLRVTVMEPSHTFLDTDRNDCSSRLTHNLAELELSPSVEASLASITQQLQDTVSSMNEKQESPRAIVVAAAAERQRRRTRTEGWLLSPASCGSTGLVGKGTRRNVRPSRIPRKRHTTLPIM